MKRLLYLVFFQIFLNSAHAQVGRVGVNTNAPLAGFHVLDSSVLFSGPPTLPFSPGLPPVSGAGTRMMWYPNKAAFRFGKVSGMAWNKDSIGVHSFAGGNDARAAGVSSFAFGDKTVTTGNYAINLGANNLASGQQSATLGSFLTASALWTTAIGIGSTATQSGAVAIGNSCDATSNNALAMGSSTLASGFGSVGIGYDSEAAGQYSTAIGQDCNTLNYGDLALGVGCDAFGGFSTAIGTSNIASAPGSFAAGYDTKTTGQYSSTIGFGTYSKAYASHAMGQFNDTTASSSSSWVLTDPILTVGIGTAVNVRRNAMTVLKNGNVGIGTIAPAKLLHVSNGSSGASPASGAVMVAENDGNCFINLLTLQNYSSGIFFGNSISASHGSILYNGTNDNGMAFNTNQGLRMYLDDAGNVGIGTDTPQRLLHVKGGSSGATSISTADLVVEDDGSAFINLLAPDANESAILFGNSTSNASGGIVYNNSNTPSGLAFRTNGNSTKAVITDVGDMGIGDLTPNAKLHVNNGSSGSGYNSGSDLMIEDDAASYLQIATPVANESGIISSTNSVSMRSAVMFMPDSSVQIRTHNTAKLTVDKNGNTTTVGEIRRTSTGNANMVPICYGGVDANGNILNAGSGNFTVSITPPGYYEITITGESYSNTGFPTVITPVSSNPRFTSIGSSGGKLVVRTWTSAAALIDTIFHFVIYKP